MALIDFLEPTTELVVTFKFRGAHYGAQALRNFPSSRGVKCSRSSTPRTSGRISPRSCGLTPKIPDGSVAAWGRSFLAGAGNDTENVLRQMMDTIRDTFRYEAREVEGTQRPGKP